jgi:hypothetical protein
MMTSQDARPPVLVIPAQPKRRKFGNVPVTIGDFHFDSKAEAARYLVLLERQQRGQISGLRCQPRYELQPAFRDAQGRMMRAIVYVADFEYSEGGQLVAVDVKGGMATQTAAFRVKAKMFRYRYPGIELRVVEM